MKSRLIAAIIILTILFSTIGISSILSSANEQASRKIIVFKNGSLSDSAKDVIIKKFGGTKVKNLKSVNGVAVLLPSKLVSSLQTSPDILRIDEDAIVTTLSNKSTQPSQIIPWGLTKIQAQKAWAITTANPINVAVIDTGIDLAHPDLKANIKGGVNTIRPSKSANDDNGHGTHVTGIIAGINNSIGVVGVGPNINLYAVKALDSNGSGYVSDIIEGIDWSIANKMKVINMSLGSSTDVKSFHDAVIKAYNAGITLVAAAGNDSGGAVNYPGAYPEVIAVSATDSNNKIAPFSSIGYQVSVAAPGVNIFSTYKNSSYLTLSGTSMATPHVTGVVALILSIPEKHDSDGDGKWSPSEVKKQIELTATDLGPHGKDKYYGAGLVNAYKAVTQ